MIDAHISRELLTSDKVTPAALLNLHGYRQVLALKFKIGDLVTEFWQGDSYVFRINKIGMDELGHVVYCEYNGLEHREEDLELAKEDDL